VAGVEESSVKLCIWHYCSGIIKTSMTKYLWTFKKPWNCSWISLGAFLIVGQELNCCFWYRYKLTKQLAKRSRVVCKFHQEFYQINSWFNLSKQSVRELHQDKYVQFHIQNSWLEIQNRSRSECHQEVLEYTATFSDVLNSWSSLSPPQLKLINELSSDRL
jgi:hypothetical protein